LVSLAGLAQLPRYSTTIEKYVVGDTGQSGSTLRAYGESSVSQAAADSQALGAINAQRSHRYAGKGSHSGTLTIDVT
jgi:hypothetical protein